MIGKPVNCIAIDEGQFVAELFDCTRALLERGYDVIAAGLDLDFRGHPFGDMLALGWLVNAYGGNVTWCIAYCECGRGPSSPNGSSTTLLPVMRAPP